MKLFIILSLLCLSLPLNAVQKQDFLALAFGGDLWKNNALGGHGFLLIHYENKILPNSKMSLIYNTDTFIINFENQINSFYWGSQLKGELFFAGLLGDYYKRGELLKQGGFKASYIEAEVYGAYNFNVSHYLKLTLPVKHWFFSTYNSTASNFTLPNKFISFEPQLIYTYWKLQNDSAFYNPHRLTPRLKGIAFKVNISLHLRNNNETWGFVNQIGFRDNNPQKVAFLLKQWLGGGLAITKLFRFQIRQSFYWSDGSDDINNERVGGLNPYVTNVAGLPWAAFISEKHVSIHPSIHLNLFDDSEVGLQFDLVYLKDILREGSNDWDIAMGLNLFLDFRLGSWQVDFKLGYAIPDDWQENNTYLSMYLLVGKKLDL